MKRILLLLLLSGITYTAIACDICGCGAGSYYIGLLPEFKKKFIGLRYQHKLLRTHLGDGGAVSYLTTDETYRSTELWGAYNIGKRFRVLGLVPLNMIERINQGQKTNKTGMGDVAVIGYYNLFSKRAMVLGNRMLVHSLWLGVGVKLPTGKYDPAEKNIGQNMQNNFQLGTGSTDIMLNAAYDVRVMDAGINTNLTYKINTGNAYQYRYGNKLTLNTLAYYKFRLSRNCGLAPNAGVLYETAERDLKNRNTWVEESGGYSLMASFGAEAYWKRVSIGINYQSPIAQRLAAGRVVSGNRAMVHLSIAL